MTFIARLWARVPKKFPLIAAVAVTTLGGVGTYKYLSDDDCCRPGAPCCHPGAACCLRHRPHQ